MGKQFDQLQDDQIKFIAAQHIFFCGTAAAEGRVNVSPKGMDSLRILSPSRVVWRNLTGSGNETAGHLALVNRMTLMWCGFEKRPLILRAYGTARTLHPRNAAFAELNAQFPPAFEARQIYDMQIDLVQASCGYAVPYFDHQGPRDTLTRWAADKGPDGVQQYWQDRNQQTIDGLPTQILADE